MGYYGQKIYITYLQLNELLSHFDQNHISNVNVTVPLLDHSLMGYSKITGHLVYYINLVVMHPKGSLVVMDHNPWNSVFVVLTTAINIVQRSHVTTTIVGAQNLDFLLKRLNSFEMVTCIHENHHLLHYRGHHLMSRVMYNEYLVRRFDVVTGNDYLVENLLHGRLIVFDHQVHMFEFVVMIHDDSRDIKCFKSIKPCLMNNKKRRCTIVLVSANGDLKVMQDSLNDSHIAVFGISLKTFLGNNYKISFFMYEIYKYISNESRKIKRWDQTRRDSIKEVKISI